MCSNFYYKTTNQVENQVSDYKYPGRFLFLYKKLWKLQKLVIVRLCFLDLIIKLNERQLKNVLVFCDHF
jgi:hypothetical protein